MGNSEAPVTPKQIYIHVGPPKTGTSTLQVWLLENAAKLREHGVWYPPNTFDPSDAFGGNFSNVAEYDPLSSLNEGFSISGERIGDILASFADSDAHTLVLSSEIFATDERLAQLKAAFPSNTKYIYYVRNPLAAIESTYNQWVKQNECCGEHDVNFTLAAGPHDGLRLIPDILKDQNTDFRPFQRGLFAGGNLVADFLMAIGLDPEDFDTDTAPEVNQSLGFVALELKRGLNTLSRKSILDELHHHIGDYPDDTANFSLIPPATRAALEARALADLAETADSASSPVLRDLAATFQAEIPKPHLPQLLAPEEFEGILAWLASARPTVFRKLHRAIAKYGLANSPYPHLAFQMLAIPIPDIRGTDIEELVTETPEAIVDGLFELILGKRLEPESRAIWVEFLERTGELATIAQLLVTEANNNSEANPLLDYYPIRLKIAQGLHALENDAQLTH